jgi:CheY-like chemotaxis protein
MELRLFSVANHGLEALTLIREADRKSKRAGASRKVLYDCVLMDLEMPGKSTFKQARSR